MGLIEFMYLIGCGISFLCAIKDFADKSRDCERTDSELLALLVLAFIIALFSWSFVIYKKYFDKE